jgi:hypothetical protein
LRNGVRENKIVVVSRRTALKNPIHGEIETGGEIPAPKRGRGEK